jgi:tripartite-type tricarboxylate transporter receptor subunit TctC
MRLLLASFILAFSSAVAAQADYPSRPIRLIVTVPPGGAADFIARLVGGKLSESLGQPVVVENRGGAGGTIAADAVAKAAPDGYTLLQNSITTHGVGPHLYSKLPYDPVKDFAPVSGLGKGGQVLVVAADSPHKSVADLVAFAKKNPGKLTFGSGSSSSRVAGELFQQMAGVELLHVPYKSNPLAITDLLGGQIAMMITDTSTGVPQIKAGKLRALGVSTAKRLPMLADVPTIDEAGVKGYDMGYWFGAYVPAQTPASVVQRLNELLANALKTQQIKAFFDTSGGEPFPTTPEQLAKFQQDETQKWGRVIKKAGIQPE